MLLYGAGGHARVIISSILANGDLIHAVFDNDPGQVEIAGIATYQSYDPAIFRDQRLIISVGDNLTRRKLSEAIWHPFTITIHPFAWVDKSVKIGEGSCILHGAVVQAGTRIGRHVIINTAASVDHDCVIADFVHIAPGVRLAGNVHVGENTLVGIGSIVVPGLTIGKNCLIAAGSVVTRNIPDGLTVRGNPARIISRPL
jgi:sugar O-acyltransferase (sialic acid O-acetyltransferase NeuD family)